MALPVEQNSELHCKRRVWCPEQKPVDELMTEEGGIDLAIQTSGWIKATGLDMWLPRPVYSSEIPPAGVSNWGGYAVACGLYLLHTCPSHQRYLKKGLGLRCPLLREQLQDWTANLPSVDKVTNAATPFHVVPVLSVTLLITPFTLLQTGGVFPFHSGAFWDTKWENGPLGHGGGWFDLSPHTFRHNQQTPGSHTELHLWGPLIGSSYQRYDGGLVTELHHFCWQ